MRSMWLSADMTRNAITASSVQRALWHGECRWILARVVPVVEERKGDPRLALLRVPLALERLGDLAEDRRGVDRRRHRVLLAVRDPLHRPPQGLPRARLR